MADMGDPVFICGLNRTGTSLLLALLDGHTQLVVAPDETHFFLYFLPQSKRLPWKKKLELARTILLEVMDANNAYYQNFLSHISVEQTLMSFNQLVKSVHDPFSLLPIAIHSYGIASNKISPAIRYWVEKTPGNEFFSRSIYNHWPQAKCLHLVRDPRDVYASNKLRAQRKGAKVPSKFIIALEWLLSVSKGIRNRKRFGAQNYQLIKYESLVREPKITIKRVIQFLDIDDQPILYYPTKGGGETSWKGNSVDQKFDEISSSVVGRWEDVLNQKEIAAIESVTGDRMGEFAYLITAPVSPVASLLSKASFLLYRLWKKDLVTISSP